MPDEPATGEAESPQDFRTTVARWDAEMNAAEKVFRNWRQRAKKINQRYTLESQFDYEGYEPKSEFNILWSNVQTLMPAIYAREPIPVVKRRHRDKDPIGRIASEILERAIKTEMEADERNGIGMDDVLRKATLGLVLEARGVAWQRYEPDIQDDTMLGESAPAEFIGRDEFLHAPLKTWAEVQKRGWVARKVDMTRAEGVARFGEVFREVPMKAVGQGHTDYDYSEEEKEVIGRCMVWELWDAQTKRVYWFSRDYQDRMLDEKEDPLHLDGFFPCPPPAFGTLGNETLVPTPDYSQYSALADELDRKTQRIDNLTGALRAAGFYDASVEGLATLLTSHGDTLIPVDNLNALVGKGSTGGVVTNVVQYLPLDMIAKALISLHDARERTKQTLYEVSGIADVLRGVVDPREKLGQSRIKQSHAGQRIDSRRRAIEYLARNIIRRKAEIIAEHYSPETIREISGFDHLPEIERLRNRVMQQAQAQIQQMMQQAQQQGIPPQMMQMPDPQVQAQQAAEQTFMQAIGLLRDEKLRGFRIEIETNSTLMPDDDEEKQRRAEFLEAASTMMERSVVAIERAPQLAPLVAEMMLFGVRGFRAGRQLETAFEEAIEQMRQAPQGAQQQPDPAEQAKMQADQAKAQADMQAMQMEAQIKMAEAQARLREIAAKTQSEQQKAEIEQALTAAEIETKIMELDIEREKLQMQAEAQRQQAMVQIATSRATQDNAAGE